MKKSLAICMLIILHQGVQAQWSAVGTGVNSSCDALSIYNGQLIAAGRYSALTIWNGSEWSDFEDGPAATAILVDGDEIYAGGQFTGGEGAKVIRHYDGNAWSILGGNADAYDLVDWNTNYKWTDIFKYNNEIYGNYNGKLLRYDTESEEMTTVGDAMTDLGLVPPLVYAGTLNNVTYYRSYIDSVERVVTWDDNIYDTLNLSAYPVRFINSLKIWNGALYMSGGFQNLQGNLYAMIKWDGVSLVPVFDYNMDVPYLFLHSTATHLFSTYYADGFGRIGVWTGSDFEDIVVDAGADVMADLNGTIYAGGFFTTFTGIPANNIAQREWVLSTEQHSRLPSFPIAPNPTSYGFTETTSAPYPRQMSIYSLTGQLIKKQVLQSGETKISVENLHSGIYILQMTSGNEIAVNRLLVQ